jgi:hypothetical protein
MSKLPPPEASPRISLGVQVMCEQVRTAGGHAELVGTETASLSRKRHHRCEIQIILDFAKIPVRGALGLAPTRKWNDHHCREYVPSCASQEKHTAKPTPRSTSCLHPSRINSSLVGSRSNIYHKRPSGYIDKIQFMAYHSVRM